MSHTFETHLALTCTVQGTGALSLLVIINFILLEEQLGKLGKNTFRPTNTPTPTPPPHTHTITRGSCQYGGKDLTDTHIFCLVCGCIFFFFVHNLTFFFFFRKKRGGWIATFLSTHTQLLEGNQRENEGGKPTHFSQPQTTITTIGGMLLSLLERGFFALVEVKLLLLLLLLGELK